ncbi:hypothetical protein [Rhizobium sp. Leaf383]|uniref:hypothetical protein n=1 Tax=Rhizobium sp. Leaf383 TaxID=1736357 RepID=UPI000713083F|nr:hypothetical protein [Rhizobium sp. Leaf383]KQS84252.1 hypothetical protein ASG58_21010 [Rhizobium sp. Leaf383]
MTDKLSIVFEGKDRELLMSYGLLNELAKLVGSPEVAPQISLDEGLREDVLGACLAYRKASGKILKKVEDMDDLDMSIDDIEAVLDWATEHVLSFFVRSLGKMVKRVESNKDVLEGLKSSLDGLQGSTSATA